jgi:hypothetical protein
MIAPDGWLPHWPDPDVFILNWLIWSNLREVSEGLGQHYPADDLMRMRLLLDLAERPGCLVEG